MLRLLPALVLTAAALLAAPAAADDHWDSGIRGVVYLGPTCPVERQGESCYTTYSTAIRIRALPERTLVKTIHSGRRGRFRTDLPPGRYHLKPQADGGAMYCRARDVTVEPGRFKTVDLDCDTGIR
jgi:hypothetical protein